MDTALDGVWPSAVRAQHPAFVREAGLWRGEPVPRRSCAHGGAPFSCCAKNFLESSGNDVTILPHESMPSGESSIRGRG